MEFNPNKTPVEIIKESVFGGTYFRDIYSVLIENSTKIHGKNLMIWKMLNKNIILHIIMTLNWINTKLKLEQH